MGAGEGSIVQGIFSMQDHRAERAVRFDVVQHLHRGIAVGVDGGLGRLIDQHLGSGSVCFCRRLHQIPLRGRGQGGQGDAHAVLQLLIAIERQPRSVFDQADHAGRHSIVFLGRNADGYRIGEHLTA